MRKKEYSYARMSPVTVMEDFPIGTLIYTDTSTNDHKVEGYIYDGKYWWPAYDTWDGWYPYHGDEGEYDNIKCYQPETDEESQAVEDWLAAINEVEEE